MNLGPHADFIVAAYAAVLCVIGGVIAWVALDYQAQRRALGGLEKRGHKRRARQRK